MRNEIEWALIWAHIAALRRAGIYVSDTAVRAIERGEKAVMTMGGVFARQEAA